MDKDQVPGVALLEDILALEGRYVVRIQKLFDSRSTRRQTNEALRYGRGQMRAGKKGQSAVLPSASLQGDPKPKRGGWRSVKEGRIIMLWNFATNLSLLGNDHGLQSYWIMMETQIAHETAEFLIFQCHASKEGI